MEQKLKYVGLLVILPLFTVAFTSSYISEAHSTNFVDTLAFVQKLYVAPIPVPEPEPGIGIKPIPIPKPLH